MDKRDFALFYSMPLSDQDWSNLWLSGVNTVMMPLNVPSDDTLKHLRAWGIKLVARLTNEDAKNMSSAQVIARLGYLQDRCDLYAAILGNEPDVDAGSRWGEDWKTYEAWDHRYYLNILLADVREDPKLRGLYLVSPGWKQRGFTEGDPPDPGQITWREITADVYNKFDANACHVYGYGWLGAVDRWRFLNQVRYWGALRHQYLWLDEVGTASGSNLQRMSAYLDMASLLLTPVGSLNPVGARVKFFCPFVSNGTGVGYDKGYILSEPECYMMLGRWINSSNPREIKFT